MKKLFALLLALTMVFSLATTAFADEATTYTISAPEGSTHTYEVYQIFVGNLNDAQTKLSNLHWGVNAKLPDGVDAGSEVAEEIIEELAAVNSKTDAEKLNVILKYVDLDNAAHAEVTATNPATVEAGYYLIKDISTTTEGETLSTYIVNVAKDVIISPKADKPESEKKVKDTNDSTAVDSEWQDSADYDMGDNVPFQITFTLPEDYAAYKNYKVIVHDRQSAGLTFNADSVNVYVGSVADENKLDGFIVTTGDAVVKCEGCENENACTFHIACDDIKTLTYNNGTYLKAGDKIIFEYTSKLNANAQIGATGNPNEMDIEFTNNPYGEGTTNTPDDVVIVFTYKLDVNKIDSESNPLAGAEFKLEKWFSHGVPGDEKAGDWVAITLTKSDDGTNFSAKGLDDGKYRITETKTPDGYNSIDPIEFVVTADHKVVITSDDVANKTGLESLTGNATDGTITLTPSTTDGSLSTDVVNKAGTELPETGGMGTTLFYIVGGFMVVAAAILLVTKKRMSVEG